MTSVDWHALATGDAAARQVALSEVINEHFAAIEAPEDLSARDLYLWAFCDGWETASEAFMEIHRKAYDR